MKYYIYTAVGVAWVGVAAVNWAYRRTQKIHKNGDYCKVAVEMLKNNTKCVQLLGGEPIKVRTLDLKKSTFSTEKVKIEIPVSGNMRHGKIYTMSTRPNVDSSWQLQYAIFSTANKESKWTIWLHPESETEEFSEELPAVARQPTSVVAKEQPVAEQQPTPTNQTEVSS